MTEKQRFLVYTRIGNMIAYGRKKNNAGICDVLKILLEKGIIQKIEDLETGYYLESSAYLEEIFHLTSHLEEK